MIQKTSKKPQSVRNNQAKLLIERMITKGRKTVSPAAYYPDHAICIIPWWKNITEHYGTIDITKTS